MKIESSAQIFFPDEHRHLKYPLTVFVSRRGQPPESWTIANADEHLVIDADDAGVVVGVVASEVSATIDRYDIPRANPLGVTTLRNAVDCIRESLGLRVVAREGGGIELFAVGDQSVGIPDWPPGIGFDSHAKLREWEGTVAALFELRDVVVRDLGEDVWADCLMDQDTSTDDDPEIVFRSDVSVHLPEGGTS